MKFGVSPLDCGKNKLKTCEFITACIGDVVILFGNTSAERSGYDPHCISCIASIEATCYTTGRPISQRSTSPPPLYTGPWWSTHRARRTSGWRTWKRRADFAWWNWRRPTTWELWRTAFSLELQSSSRMSAKSWIHPWNLCCSNRPSNKVQTFPHSIQATAATVYLMLCINTSTRTVLYRGRRNHFTVIICSHCFVDFSLGVPTTKVSSLPTFQAVYYVYSMANTLIIIGNL